jgi:hypothetical protein
MAVFLTALIPINALDPLGLVRSITVQEVLGHTITWLHRLDGKGQKVGFHDVLGELFIE